MAQTDHQYYQEKLENDLNLEIIFEYKDSRYKNENLCTLDRANFKIQMEPCGDPPLHEDTGPDGLILQQNGKGRQLSVHWGSVTVYHHTIGLLEIVLEITI